MLSAGLQIQANTQPCAVPQGAWDPHLCPSHGEQIQVPAAVPVDGDHQETAEATLTAIQGNDLLEQIPQRKNTGSE